MEKFLFIILSVCPALFLIACGTQTGEQTSPLDTSSSTPPNTDGTESTGGNENKTTDAPVFDLQKGAVTLNNGI